MIFPEAGIGSRLFPSDLSGFLNDYYRQHGVEVLTQSTVTDVVMSGSHFRVASLDKATGTTREIEVDGIVAGIGAQPNVDLARAAGLTVDNGIVVDPFLRTSHPDVYAAGDVAAYWQSVLGQRRRVEHEDNATHDGSPRGSRDGRRTGAVRAPPLLLLGHVRPGLRGGRGYRFPVRGGSGVGGAVSRGCAHLPPPGTSAGSAPLERLGPARCGPRSDRRSRRDPFEPDARSFRSRIDRSYPEPESITSATRFHT